MDFPIAVTSICRAAFKWQVRPRFGIPIVLTVQLAMGRPGLVLLFSFLRLPVFQSLGFRFFPRFGLRLWRLVLFVILFFLFLGRHFPRRGFLITGGASNVSSGGRLAASLALLRGGAPPTRVGCLGFCILNRVLPWLPYQRQPRRLHSSSKKALTTFRR